jgi:predicted TPR repeat methyltransferase
MSSPSYKDFESHFAKACDFHTHSDFTAAEKIYCTLLELMPDSSLLHYNMGLLYYETENFEKALSHYTAARHIAPQDPDILFNYALCQKKLGLLHDAITSFHLFTSTYPHDSDGFYNLGNCYRELEEFEKAVLSYQGVLKIDPDHLPTNKNLAYIRHLLGDSNKAIVLYKHILSLEPDNAQVTHMIAAVTGEDAAQAPSEYIQGVFDNYSESFETHLLEELHYTVPARLRSGIDKLNHTSKSFSKCIDLGCGTGLAGIEFYNRCEHLTGIDISGKMIEKAKSKNIYDVLEIAEAISFLNTRKDEYDLVIGADFLTYIGDLNPVFNAVTSATTEQALFCFSTENSAQRDFDLCTTGRFAHSREYIIETTGKYGWKCLDTVEAGLRKEKDEWVEGTLYFTVKSD